MRIGGLLFAAAALCALIGCTEPEPSGPLGLTPPDAPEDELDPRARIRGALEKLGHDDEIPEDASLAELEALLDEKVQRGTLPEEHAKKLLKVLESADQHNKRLEDLDQQLFGESTY